MDFVSMAMVNRLKNDGGMGYTERKTPLTWDGDITGKEVCSIFPSMYLVSDTPVSRDDVRSITVCGILNGVETWQGTFSFDEYSVHDLSVIGVPGFGVSINENFPLIVVADSDGNVDVGNGEIVALKRGVYFAYVIGGEMESDTYVSKLELETVHPIDPKYLPGVCLPVVDLTEWPTEEGTPLTEAESTALNAIYDGGTPCIVGFGYGPQSGSKNCIAMLFYWGYSNLTEEEKYFVTRDGDTSYQLVDIDGQWVFRIRSLG